MMMRMLVRVAILSLAVYGAKRLYETYFGSADEARKAGSAMAARVGQASARVKEEARDAADDVATHARAVSQEIRETATDVVDLSDPTGADDEQPQPRSV
jgi:hypothetical protein